METTIVYRGYIGIMEKEMETTIMENQMEKKMENEVETGIIMGYIPYICCSQGPCKEGAIGNTLP